MPKKVTAHQTEDGKLFLHVEDAIAHEQRLANQKLEVLKQQERAKANQAQKLRDIGTINNLRRMFNNLSSVQKKFKSKRRTASIAYTANPSHQNFKKLKTVLELIDTNARSTAEIMTQIRALKNKYRYDHFIFNR